MSKEIDYQDDRIEEKIEEILSSINVNVENSIAIGVNNPETQLGSQGNFATGAPVLPHCCSFLPFHRMD
jgi:hypothetical protein